jgi:hypothetical protein
MTYIYIYILKTHVGDRNITKFRCDQVTRVLRVLDIKSPCLIKHHVLKIFIQGTRWRLLVILTPQPLYPLGKDPQYPFYRRLGEPQSGSGHGSEEKNLCPFRKSNPDSLIIQLISQPTQTNN